MKNAVFALFLGLFLAACSSDGEAKSAGSKELLKIGTEGLYAPFTYHDESGKLVGFDVEVAQAVAQKAGFEVEFFETNWDSIFAGINAGRFDMIANQINLTPEREQKYALSEPYMLSYAAIATRADDDRIKEFGDIKGLSIGQAQDSIYTEMVKNAGANLVVIDGLASSLKALSQGRFDGTINDELGILDYIKKTGDKNIKIAVRAGDPAKTVFLLKKEKADLLPRLNAAISELHADGTLAKISVKYFGADVTK